MSTFLDSVMQYKNPGMPMATLGFQTRSKTFQIMYCMMFYLKKHQNYQKSQ